LRPARGKVADCRERWECSPKPHFGNEAREAVSRIETAADVPRRRRICPWAIIHRRTNTSGRARARSACEERPREARKRCASASSGSCFHSRGGLGPEKTGGGGDAASAKGGGLDRKSEVSVGSFSHFATFFTELITEVDVRNNTPKWPNLPIRSLIHGNYHSKIALFGRVFRTSSDGTWLIGLEVRGVGE